MTERDSTDSEKRRRWLDAFTVRTLAVNIALIATIFLTRNRWERWRGIFHLWHFWLIVVLSLALAVSIRRDVRSLRRR